jgi:16S rRNA processing protein RimM
LPDKRRFTRPTGRPGKPAARTTLTDVELIEVVVGRIGKPHGIRGELTIDVRTDEPERRFAVGTQLRAQPPPGSASRLACLTVARTRWHQQTLLAGFEEIGDRNAAEAVRGTVLLATVAAQERPEDPEEFYDLQLVGLVAYDEAGTRLGELTAVTHGAQDLLTIRTPDGRDALVPFVAALVPSVDLEAGRVVIADRPGLVAPYPDSDEA